MLCISFSSDVSTSLSIGELRRFSALISIFNVFRVKSGQHGLSVPPSLCFLEFLGFLNPRDWLKNNNPCHRELMHRGPTDSTGRSRDLR